MIDNTENEKHSFEKNNKELLPKAPKDIPLDLEPLWHVLLRLEGRPPPQDVIHA